MLNLFIQLCMLTALPFSIVLFAIKIVVWAGYFSMMFGWPFWLCCTVFITMLFMSAIGLYAINAQSWLMKIKGGIDANRD